jgi:hypothetical protein
LKQCTSLKSDKRRSLEKLGGNDSLLLSVTAVKGGLHDSSARELVVEERVCGDSKDIG